MIDDLTTLGTKEPYRMFTSRAEYRLSLRAENADLRLTRRGHEAGFVSEERFRNFSERERMVQHALERLYTFVLPSARWTEMGFALAPDGRQRSAADILSSPGVAAGRVVEAMHAAGDDLQLAPRVVDNVETAVKYRGYLERQQREIDDFKRGDALPLPPHLDYTGMPALSKEEQELLNTSKPATVHAAGRIPGVRPSTQMLLFQLAKRYARDRLGNAAEAGDAVGALGRSMPAGAPELPLPSQSFGDGILPAEVALGSLARTEH
jgi:tRNA uridine 5-carboxymethylaminomethyl modification enzyme